MPSTLRIIALLLILGSPVAAQQPVHGIVRDHATGEPLAHAQVLIESGRSILSGPDGRFRFALLEGNRVALRVVRLGYAQWDTTLTAPPAEPLQVALVPVAEDMAGITVVGRGAGAIRRYPGATATLDQARLQAAAPLSAGDVLRTIPGIHLQDEEGMGLRANIGIRGLDPDRSRTVLVLEDGLPVALGPYGEPEMYYTPPIDRMSRVEVIKGSGSILFGPQTIGGVVNFVTPDPPATPGGRLALRVGSGGFGLAKAFYGGSWGQAGLAGTALHRRAQDLSGLEFTQTDLTGKVILRPTDRDAVGLKLGGYQESSNATYVGLTDSLYRADPDLHPAPNDRLRISRYAASASHERRWAGGTTLRTALYAYQTTRNWQRQDYSYADGGARLVFRNTTGNRNRSFEVLGIEPRLRGIAGSTVIEAGVRAHHEQARDQHINGGTGTSPTGEIRDDEQRSGTAFAAFLQTQWALGSTVSLTAGLRAEWFEFQRHLLRTRVRRTVSNPDGTTSVVRRPEDVDLVTRDQVADLIPGAGLRWHVSTAVELFAGVHRGFAPPRIKDALVYDDQVLPAGQQPGSPVSLQLDAERSWNTEVGVRAHPGPGIAVEATAFRLDFSNQIVEPSASAGSAAQARLANQGRTLHQGLELGVVVDWGARAGWPVRVETGLNWTWVDARFRGDRWLERSPGDTVNTARNRLPYAPEHLVNASLEISRGDRAGIRLEAARFSRQYADNFETVVPSSNGRNGLIPGAATGSASGWYQVPGTAVRATLAVRNLTGSRHIVSRRPEGIRPALPRLVQFGIELSY